ncbi:N-acetylmuramoyl-L-alanine amidase [Parvularcula sp. LCG005]|uniref:N-acetylmuramoyl-L-alanine amidase n=1 Tax=Parvularcula sp. LCG005 TaxID=3078805 RepID=UPI00294264D0|nr:N-acetylmuramoyl-L-alanine amidase [Parvularcula sp. LCG005]WOI52055.1 N-acetylmuramoyl-L-alanine amidase [Parvularcula sp. LCG005]
MKPIIDAPSPNCDERAEPISLVVLHYTGMESGKEALDRLTDAASKVSAHYLIEQDGQVYALVPEEKRAWHAGLGGWGPHDNVNQVSIGIELVNRGHFWGYEEFPEAQMTALEDLLAGMMQRHGLKPHQVVGHSDIAPERKEDPGEKFPWDRFAAKGLTLGTYQGGADGPLPDCVEAIEMLAEIGYRVTPTHPVAATLAFQRRFCPQDLGQGLSPLTRAAISAVAGRLRV